MKGLSIEEKAKRYDEAIIRCSRLWESDMITRENYEYIFPELKESEDEEIKEMLKVAVERTPWMQDKKEKCYEWLEKQGEQKTVDDLTQQEAMDIAVAECFEQGEQKPVVIPKFRIGDIIKDTEDGEVFIIRTITKDKYIYTDDSFDWIKGQDKYELVEQKPWSEEDEKILDGVIINYKSGYLPSVEKRDKIIEKLESLKGRVQPQNTWKPSDEQMHYLSWVANVKLGDSLVEQEVSKHLNELLEDLKKLRSE